MATDIEKLVVLVEGNTKSYERAMARLEGVTKGAINRSTKAFASLDSQLSRMGSTAMRVAGMFGIAFSAQALIGGIKSAVDEAGKLVDTADKIGITTKALQELSFAGSQTGVDFGEMSGALSFFNKQVGEASRGGGDLLEILKANGVAIRDQAGNIRPVTELLGEYADLVQNAGSAQERTTLITKAFGKSSDELINTFARGKAGLAEFADEANRTGQVIEDGLLRRAEEIGDRWDAFTNRLSVGFKSFVLTVVDGVATTIDSLAEMQRRAAGISIAGAAGASIGVSEAGPQTPQTIAELQAALGIGAAPARGRTVIPTKSEGAAKVGKPLDLRPKVDETTDAMRRLEDQIQDTARSAAQFTSSFINDLMQGRDAGESLLNVLGNIGQQMLSAGLQSIFSSFMPGLGGIFGGFRASGGPVMSGKAYMVGEKGPEMFIPNTSGRIAANSNSAGGVRNSFTIVVNGARGNTEISQMVEQGVKAGIGAYDYGKQRQQALAG